MKNSTTKETKIRNIVKGTGENYEKQTANLKSTASSYYYYIFGEPGLEINPNRTVYSPTAEDIKAIRNNETINGHMHSGEPFIETIKTLCTKNYLIDTSISSLKNLMFNSFETFLAMPQKSIVFTISYNSRDTGLKKRLGLLKHISCNKNEDGFKIVNYFDDNPVDKQYEQIHELSCLIQNLYNGIFPGFYTHEEIEALAILFTGDKAIKHQDIPRIWDKLSPSIKRILPTPQLDILNLLAKYPGNPPHPFFTKGTF